MKRIVFAVALIVSAVGCTTTERDNRPIVSPDAISTEESSSSEPSIPYYKPIWEK